MNKNLKSINELSTEALIKSRIEIEKALEANFFDSTFSEQDKIRYVNLAQIITQVSVITTANVLINSLDDKKDQ